MSNIQSNHRFITNKQRPAPIECQYKEGKKNDAYISPTNLSSGIAGVLTPASNQTTQRGTPKMNFIEALKKSPSVAGKSSYRKNDSREVKGLMAF